MRLYEETGQRRQRDSSFSITKSWITKIYNVGRKGGKNLQKATRGKGGQGPELSWTWGSKVFMSLGRGKRTIGG